MDTTLEFSSSSSMSWCGGLLDSDVGCVIFPNSSDSSATPASSSVAVVHLWPNVSTPSRSSRRFLSVFPFNLQFRGRSHLIPFAFSFSACTVRVASRRPLPPVYIRPPPSSPPPVSTPTRALDVLFPFRASAEPLAARSPGDDDAGSSRLLSVLLRSCLTQGRRR
jgi:hypothetical protein